MRDSIKPTITEKEDYSGSVTRHDHPAFGVATVHRGRTGGQPPKLFGSDAKANSSVTLTINRAARERSLHSDRELATDQLVSLTMTEGQWGALVTSAGIGSGVPVTLDFTERDGNLPGIEEAPRIQESLNELRSSVGEMLTDMKESLADLEDAVESKAGIRVTREALRRHRANLANAESNSEFVARSAYETAENVLDRLRADIDSQMAESARSVGLDYDQMRPPQIEG